MATLDPVEYVSLPFAVYTTLEEKLQALLNGEMLLIKKFEQRKVRTYWFDWRRRNSPSPRFPTMLHIPIGTLDSGLHLT